MRRSSRWRSSFSSGRSESANGATGSRGSWNRTPARGKHLQPLEVKKSSGSCTKHEHKLVLFHGTCSWIIINVLFQSQSQLELERRRWNCTHLHTPSKKPLKIALGYSACGCIRYENRRTRSGEPRLQVEFLGGSVVEGARDDVDDLVGDLQRLAEGLSVANHLVHHLVRLAVVRRRDAKLLHLSWDAVKKVVSIKDQAA